MDQRTDDWTVSELVRASAVEQIRGGNGIKRVDRGCGLTAIDGVVGFATDLGQIRHGAQRACSVRRAVHSFAVPDGNDVDEGADPRPIEWAT
jgi:hypothetical protein